MAGPRYVHIVDRDYHRRARLAGQLYENGIHAEIYEGFEELIKQPPSRGAVLVSGDGSPQDLHAGMHALQSDAGYLPVAVYSSAPVPQEIVRAISCGALDYLIWPFSASELMQALERIFAEGERRARMAILKAEARRQVEGLTHREREVLKLLIAGDTSNNIGSKLGISPRTVDTHRANLMSRINARSIADVVRIGIYAGLDSEPDATRSDLA